MNDAVKAEAERAISEAGLPPLVIPKGKDLGRTLTSRVNAFERRCLLRYLERNGGNITRSAEAAGRNRTEFYKLLARHKIDPKVFRCAPSS